MMNSMNPESTTPTIYYTSEKPLWRSREAIIGSAAVVLGFLYGMEPIGVADRDQDTFSRATYFPDARPDSPAVSVHSPGSQATQTR